MLVKNAINHYLNNHITLSQRDISAAAKSREWFLKRIENVINNRINEPKLYSENGGSFVNFGSYFKGTKVSDVDEYDILVVIDSNNGVYTSAGEKIGFGQGSVSPNPKYLKRYFKEDGSGVSPSILLNWLKGIVEEVVFSYGGEAPIRDGQAITATIKSMGLKIDLVPAGIFKNNSGTVFYNIPDGSVRNDWITTSPKLDIDNLNDLSKNRADFKNIIRIMKKIKDTYNLKVSSFTVEMSVVNYVQGNDWYNELFTDTVLSIRHLAGLFQSGIIEDIYNQNQNLISKVQNLDEYTQRLNTIADRLVRWNDGVDSQDEVIEKVTNCFNNTL